jgi:hypothetical protein
VLTSSSSSSSFSPSSAAAGLACSDSLLCYVIPVPWVARARCVFVDMPPNQCVISLTLGEAFVGFSYRRKLMSSQT